jgi:hypothetical protein
MVLIYHRQAAADGIRLARKSRPVTPFPSLLAAVWGD